MNVATRGQLALWVCANLGFRVSLVLIAKDQIALRGVFIAPAASQGPGFRVQLFTVKVGGPLQATVATTRAEKFTMS